MSCCHLTGVYWVGPLYWQRLLVHYWYPSLGIAIRLLTIRTSDILLAEMAVHLPLEPSVPGFSYSGHVGNISSGTVVFGNPLEDWLSICLRCWSPALSTAGILSQSRGLIALTSGEEVAWNQGVDIYSIRRNTLLFAAIGVGTCVAQCGPIAFVGLVVPTLFD